MVKRITQSTSGRGDSSVISIDRAYVPLALVASLIITTAYMATVITSERARIDARITEVGQQITTVQGSLNKLAKALSNRSSTRWTKDDMAIWCVKAERVNASFKCPANLPDGSVEIEDGIGNE